jgi:alginate O-acetyltransferase complex protein AlgI
MDARPRWIVMWGLAFAIYAACKLATWASSRRPAPWWRHAAYVLAWPGMDAAAFLAGRADRPRRLEWLSAAACCATGTALLGWSVRHGAAAMPRVAGWIGMAGVALILHFGLFALLSCTWRRLGVDARPLMASPLWATSLADFWSRRWNTAFRDLTHRGLFAPLRRRLGARAALLAAFVASGLIHEAVITLPAGGGYGGPTVFFTAQGLGLLVERTTLARALGLERAVAGWAFTMAVLVVPLGLLFPPPFVDRVIVPMLEALRP